MTTYNSTMEHITIIIICIMYLGVSGNCVNPETGIRASETYQDRFQRETNRHREPEALERPEHWLPGVKGPRCSPPPAGEDGTNSTQTVVISCASCDRFPVIKITLDSTTTVVGPVPES